MISCIIKTEVCVICRSRHRHEVLIIHDIMRKPNSRIVLLYIFHKFILKNTSEAFSHFVSEESTPKGLVTRQTLNLT